MDEKEYAQLYNQGYLLQKYNPKLSAQIIGSLTQSNKDQDLALLAGIKQQQIEEKQPELSKEVKGVSRQTDYNKGPRKDNMDLDKG